MPIKILTVCVVALLGLASLSLAEEEGAPKPKKADAHWSGSLVGYILYLPEVVKWRDWESRHGSEGPITVWGEGKAQVNGQSCSYVAVGRNVNQKVHVIRRFCVSDMGFIWIQKYADPDSNEEPGYMAYDVWQTQCKPAADSYGKC